MDVTFFETTLYFHKTALQGENLGEYQFLGSEKPTLTSFFTPRDIEFLDSPSDSPKQPPSQTSQPKSDLLNHSSVVQDNNPYVSELKKPTLTVDDQNIIVYQRRRGQQKETEVQTQPIPLQTYEPESKSHETHTQVEDRDSSNSAGPESAQTDDDLPIAIRKGVRDCRSRPLYPVCKHVSYDGLSQGYSPSLEKSQTYTFPIVCKKHCK
ncbi:hypothetical protein ACOSQ2_010215 [Xanthoceras sorbifolium]